MKLPPRIGGPDVGPLDFLHTLDPHKKQWHGAMHALERTHEMDLLYTNFQKTWADIKTFFDQKNIQGLKDMQSRLSPWPPVVMLALEPQHSALVHAAWQTLLEFHTCARFALEQPELMAKPEWKTWRLALHEKEWPGSLRLPARTNVPGVLRAGHTVAVVTTQPFAFTKGGNTLHKVHALHKDATSFRFQSPACSAYDTSYQLAAEDLFGAHSDREISKLAFWTMVGIQKEPEAAASMIWRPRYYGGPPGTSSWALHDAGTMAGQAAAKARTTMLHWMTALSDSLHEQLHVRNDIGWNTAHQDFLQAYTRSWYAVTRLGVAHKRTAAQVNELLGYTASIHKQLERVQNPVAPELGRVLQWTTLQLQQSNSNALAMALL